MAFYAHKRVEPDGEMSRQTVYAHLIGTAQRAGQCLRSVGLENTGYMAGLLHDMGKYTEEFQQYLEAGDPGRRGSVIHTFQGCRYMMEIFHGEGATFPEIVCAELIAFAIGAHHGLFDCVDPAQRLGVSYRWEKKDISYEAAAAALLSEIPEREIRARFKKAAAEGETPAKNVNAELKFGEETWVPIESGHDYVENNQWFLHHLNYFTVDGRLNFSGAPNPAGLNSKTVFDGNYILEFDLYGTNTLSTLVLVIHGSEKLPSFYEEPYFMFIQPAQICMPGQTAAKAEDFSAIPNWAAGSGVRLRFVVLEKSIIVYGANVTETGVGDYVKLVTFSNLTTFGGAAARTSGTIRLLGYDAPLTCSIDNLSVTTLVENDGTIKENFDNNA